MTYPNPIFSLPKAVRLDRLTQLIDFVADREKAGAWTFFAFVDDEPGYPVVHGCGTHHCAWGCAPAVWPKRIDWHNCQPCLKKQTSYWSPPKSIMTWFKMDAEDAKALFYFEGCETAKQLPKDCTREQWLAWARGYVAKVQALR